MRGCGQVNRTLKYGHIMQYTIGGKNMLNQMTRRNFLKSTSALAALVALSACSGGESSSTATAKPYGYATATVGPLGIELGSITSYNSVKECRFRITNNSAAPITLTKDNFTAQFNGKDAPFCGQDEMRTDFSELFSQMPIPANESVKGYVAFHVSEQIDSYKITVKYGGKQTVFASDEKEKSWYE